MIDPQDSAASPGSPSSGRFDQVIRVRGARMHNLRSVDLDLPRDALTVLTGVSGSGKSSLAFDTIFAEGQRQYIETLSAYARQFLDQLQRPEVDLIDGLEPTLCIDQQPGARNPRSTVATVTELYDYLRLLMARAGTPHCYRCGQPILQQSPDAIAETLERLPQETKLVLMAPMVRGRRGAHREVLAEIRKAGLVRARVDGRLYELDAVPDLAPRKTHTIDAVVDRILIRPGLQKRIADSLRLALRLGDGRAIALYQRPDAGDWQERLFNTEFACPDCGVSYEELEPRTFSFNSPYGACPTCDGMGLLERFDPELVVADWTGSPAAGAVLPFAQASAAARKKFRQAILPLLERLGGGWDEPLDRLKPAARRKLLAGNGTRAGLLGLLDAEWATVRSERRRDELAKYRGVLTCPACGGGRLRPEALHVRLGGRAIHEITALGAEAARDFFTTLELAGAAGEIARPILAEIAHRLAFLNAVGVGYLTLDRPADTLSGGELQRVRLATSIGSGLVGVCYVLDEPSIGLHQRDNDALIAALRNLQQRGNTVLVVEHDEAMMRAADWIVDIGPGAGADGGRIVAAGPLQAILENGQSITGDYLAGRRAVPLPEHRRTPDPERAVEISGAATHNLKNVSVRFPLGCLIGVTGVSGSGKSSLVNDTLYPALARRLGTAAPRPGPHDRITGGELVDKLIRIDQAPIGRSPRSCPATFTGVMDEIRKVYAGTRDAKQRGFTSSRFSFNSAQGRCPQCQGQGQERIEMNFLSDLFIPCTACRGQRFNRQTLQVRYKGATIADVLDMTVQEAAAFFENFARIDRTLRSLESVGLGYLHLGQPSTTLSGGEAQRIKLATELSRQETGDTLYLLDEPTTGLHFEDVRRLLSVLQTLVDRGNTVIVIEHNLEIAKSCDWLIDLGPEGGDAGGYVLAEGPPEAIASAADNATGQYLQKLLAPKGAIH